MNSENAFYEFLVRALLSLVFLTLVAYAAIPIIAPFISGEDRDLATRRDDVACASTGGYLLRGLPGRSDGRFCVYDATPMERLADQARRGDDGVEDRLLNSLYKIAVRKGDVQLAMPPLPSASSEEQPK